MGVYLLPYMYNIIKLEELLCVIEENHCVICDICINLWGVAVLELDSHPDHNKGPGQVPCVCPKTHPIDHRS